MARIAGVNIPQNKLVKIGLTYIYGIGNKFSKQICTALDISNSKNSSSIFSSLREISRSYPWLIEEKSFSNEIICEMLESGLCSFQLNGISYEILSYVSS